MAKFEHMTAPENSTTFRAQAETLLTNLGEFSW